MVHDEHQPNHDEPPGAEEERRAPIWALPSASRPLVLGGVAGA